MSSGTNFFDFQKSLTTGTRRPPAPKPEVGLTGNDTLTVSQLTGQIERALKSGLPASIAVKGEVSNYKHHGSSGHAYFTLKDSDACIDCVMFKSDFAKLKFKPGDGLELLATARVGVYAQRGRYQLYVTNLLPVGQGALELAFQQLRTRLEREGLFEPDRKKAIPRYPQHLALVTSKETAALQDMLKVLKRFPFVKLSVYHVPVQGDGSAERIAAAIQDLNQRRAKLNADLILLARGGGSLEDLWEFNEEIVARAIVDSKIPVVTGIGHEVDVSIADLAADYHAHTPTEAAQVVTAHWRNCGQYLDDAESKLRKGLRDTVTYYRQRVTSIERHEVFRRPLDRVNQLRQLVDDREKDLTHAASTRLHVLHRRLSESSRRLDKHRPAALIDRLRQRLDHQRHTLGLALRSRVRLIDAGLVSADRRLRNAAKVRTQAFRKELDSLDAQLRLVGPEQVLQRGYSITCNKRTGQVIRSASQVKAGDKLVTRLADGQIESVTDDPNQPGLFE
jgi:exodeoxyribonuclease VII large subunit